MKQDNRTTRELAPDFIADMETPEGFKVTKLNDAEYMGERYGWSSNAKGWFRLSEHPEQPIKEAVICEHCGKDKKVITGLCPHCGKFPAIKEQSSNRGEGFTADDIYSECLKWFEKRQLVFSGVNAGSYLDREDFETNARWIKDQFINSEAENQALRESNTRLKEALQPFAKMWGELTEEKVRQGGVVYQYNNSQITVSDLFNAFDALNPIK